MEITEDGSRKGAGRDARRMGTGREGRRGWGAIGERSSAGQGRKGQGRVGKGRIQ